MTVKLMIKCRPFLYDFTVNNHFEGDILKFQILKKRHGIHDAQTFVPKYDIFLN